MSSATAIMEELKNKSLSLGATNFCGSEMKNKRFYVVYDNKKINFGSPTAKTFFDHQDEKKKIAWLARHTKIKNKTGEYVYKLKTSPSYWSKNLLWM